MGTKEVSQPLRLNTAGAYAERADIAGLPPAAVSCSSICLFVMTPLTNSIVRTAEDEADLFGL